MFRFPPTLPLLIAGTLLVGFWHVAPKAVAPAIEAPTRENSPSISVAKISAPETLTSPAQASSSLMSLASPFSANGIQAVASNLPSTVAQYNRQQFERSLREYKHGALSPEQKIRIRQALHEVKHDASKRALLLDTFFSNDTQLAQAVYELMLAADLKDVGLLEQLIERENRSPHNAANAKANKARIVDLIADLGSNEQARYSMIIDGYLAQLVNSGDAQLRTSAASQRIWYLNQHQPYNLAVQEKYIVDSAQVVREEVYSLIEARIANQTLAGQTQLVPALHTVLRANELAASAEEKARINALLAALKDGKQSL